MTQTRAVDIFVESKDHLILKLPVYTVESAWSYVIDIVTVDGLATQGTRTSAAMKLILFSQNILASAPEGFINSLAPGRPGCHFKTAIFNLVLLIGIFTSFKDNALRWMPWDLTDDKSTLVQVMAWCRQATSHYLNQCWPRSLPPYGITRPQWFNSSWPGDMHVFQ